MAEILKPEKIKGLTFDIEIALKRVAKVFITNVSTYFLFPEPNKEVLMYMIEFQGILDGRPIGPWFAYVDSSKATEENIKLAIRDVIKKMVGV